MKSTLRLIVAALIPFAFFSCDNSTVVDEHVRIKDEAWKSEDIVKVEATIADSLTPYDIYINVRNSGSYPFSNLYLFMNTCTPGGAIARDTIELTLADEKGQWLGDGMGDVRENSLLFKKGFMFPHTGTYRFELEQAMRVDPLPGIMDAGIRIEHSKK